MKLLNSPFDSSVDTSGIRVGVGLTRKAAALQ